MNTKKTLITIMITVFCYSFSYAQRVYATPSEWATEHKKTIATATYIFEGTVQQQKCYYERHINGQLLTCTIIKITKIYKGSPQIKLGTIKVITEQGGGVGNGPYVNMADADGIYRGHYIILASATTFEPADSSLKHTLTTDNPITVECFDHIDFSLQNLDRSDTTSVRWDGAHYKTPNDLYSFLSNCGLTIEEEDAEDSTKLK